MKITVDRDRCVGSAYCQRIAPATFDLGDDGIAVVLAADVAGYSRLMGADEESALVALKGAERACRSENRRSVMSAVQGKNSVGREAQCDF